jgi:hypothetical protein
MDLHILCNYMNQSSPQEANSCSASQEFPYALWTMKVHPSVYNSSPLSPILSQVNPFQTYPSYFFKIKLMLSPYLHTVSSFLAFWQHGVKLAPNKSIPGTDLCTLFLGLNLRFPNQNFVQFGSTWFYARYFSFQICIELTLLCHITGFAAVDIYNRKLNIYASCCYMQEIC